MVNVTILWVTDIDHDIFMPGLSPGAWLNFTNHLPLFIFVYSKIINKEKEDHVKTNCIMSAVLLYNNE